MGTYGLDIKPEMSTEEKLRLANKCMAHGESHYSEMWRQQDRDAGMYGGHQWPAEALDILKRQGRAPLTMNVLHSKIQLVIGMALDMRREAVASPMGGEDRCVAELLNSVLATVRDEVSILELDSQVYEGGLVTGDHALHIDVEPDPRQPSWIRFVCTVVPGREVIWDPASRKRSHEDARYVFWPRWVSSTEFLAEWPDKADKLQELMSEDYRSPYDRSESRNVIAFGSSEDNEFIDPRMRSSVDRKARRIRVVHLEYKRPVKVHFVGSEDGKRNQRIDKVVAQALQSRPSGTSRVFSVWDEEIGWLEYMDNEVLFDDVTPMPYTGFSLVPFTCYTDMRTGFPYGIVRHLTDPQLDVNKAYSQSLDHLIAQGKPGWIAEESALTDRAQFEEDNNRAGSVAMVKDGALGAGKVQPRKMAEISPAVVQRLTTSLEMVDRISGIMTAPEDPARAVEAATTHMLREKKALRGLARVFANYTDYQRNVSRRLLEGITQAMPIDQILEILSSDERYTYMSGQETPDQMYGQIPQEHGLTQPGSMQQPQLQAPQQGPSGYAQTNQMPEGPHIMDNELGKAIPLEDIREARYNVQLEASSESEAYRVAQLNILLQVLGGTNGAVPVDPEIILELAAGSRSQRERLLRYQRQVVQSQSQAGQVEAQAKAALAAAQASAFQAEAQARILGAQSDAQQGDQKLAQERVRDAARSLIELLTIWERADEAEKPVIQRAGSALQ